MGPLPEPIERVLEPLVKRRREGGGRMNMSLSDGFAPIAAKAARTRP